MKERLEKIIQSLRSKGFELEFQERQMQAPFCINADVVGIGGERSALIFGQCTKDSSMWHAFLAIEKVPLDHPLDYLKPVNNTDENGVRVAIFDPDKIADESIVMTIKKFIEADSLFSLFF